MDRTGRIGAPLAPAPPLVPAPSERSVRQKGQPHDGDTLDRRPAAYRLHFQNRPLATSHRWFIRSA